MIQSTKIKAIANEHIKDGANDKRQIPEGLFKPHMTALISGKTGSGKSHVESLLRRGGISKGHSDYA